MNSYETIKNALMEIASNNTAFSLDQPEEITHGDYATNIAFMLSKKEGISPKAYAEKIIPALLEVLQNTVEKIEVAGPGLLIFS
jgi:arginyl-tRNA synthetase